MSKCPPGVICFENFTFIYVIIAIVVMLYLFYIRQSSINNDKQSPAMNTTSNNNYSQNGIFPRPSYSFSNVQNDVLMNPYTPPLKDERVFMSNDVRGGVPININTRAVDTSYRQIGLLKRMNGQETLLPLMGTTVICRA